MAENKKQFGNKGEQLAAKFLADKGFEIIEQNYRYGKGEIDIIAKDSDTLVFVEVKTRKNLEFGPPELAITKGKQSQIKKIANAYLYEKKIKDIDCRIDVVAILMLKESKPVINHIVNAF